MVNKGSVIGPHCSMLLTSNYCLLFTQKGGDIIRQRARLVTVRVNIVIYSIIFLGYYDGTS